MKTTLIAVLLAVPTGLVLAQSPLKTLVETEKQFAQFSKENTTKAAFKTFLAPDGLLFQKGKPVNGQKFWEESEDRPGKLTWQPVAADISASGDFGYTTGPWEFRPKTLEDKPVAFGHYVTVWKKQTDGKFRAALDLGITHPAPPQPPVDAIRAATGIRSVTSTDSAKVRSELLAFDNQFIKALEKNGPEATYRLHLSPQARVYRMGRQPFTERPAIDSLLKRPETVQFDPLNASVAPSGDLGYVYGNTVVTTTESEKAVRRAGNYLRIWKKDSQGQWKIVLDLINLEPPS
ncbi:YybH family protein [Larkinella soli]|uniref:YybH family protein n=1 Tax=Larkinella soli TaxID=1770527 RepID=UPI000FFB1A55|nr:nuclear transport factor 2 family protein [Larkinella soli]